MPGNNLNSFICPHCLQLVVEPYINCPDCFKELKEIKRIKSRASRNLMVGILFTTVGTLMGFSLGEHGGYTITSIIFNILGGIIIIYALIKYLNAKNKKDFMHVK